MSAQQVQGVLGRLPLYGDPVAREDTAGHGALDAVIEAEEDQADRLPRRATTGAGYAGHGQPDVRGSRPPRPGGHGLDHRSADRTVLAQHLRIDPQERDLGGIAVGDQGQEEIVGGAGDVGEQ